MKPFRLPKRCILETEYRCNLKCRSCSLWKENYRKLRGAEKGVLTVEETRALQGKLSGAGIKRLSYIGGEPFLDPALGELALDAKTKGMLPNVVTNGNALTPEMTSEVAEKGLFNTVIFSLDGPENVHDFMRGRKGAFRKAFAAMKSFQKLKALKKLRYPRIFVYSTVSKLNYRHLEAVYRTAKSVNANKLRFQLASSINEKLMAETNEALGFEGLKTHSYLNELGMSPEELEKAKKSIRKIKNLAHGGMRLETESVLDGPPNKNCKFIYEDFVVTPSGNILPCPMLTNFMIGNLKKGDIGDIFAENRDKIDRILALAESGTLPICRQCCVEKII